MDNSQNLTEIVKSYKNVISEFKKRGSVLSGKDLAWKGGLEVATFENTPFGIGDGLGTTGWCVSASQALLNDKVFQILLGSRNAKAKLISIDIKEQFHGYCYNGSQNKWHTSILVEDNGFKFIIDITIRQFGNEFVDKDIWDLESWLYRLRSPLCKHKLTDFDDNPINIAPVSNESKTVINKDLYITSAVDNLRNIISLDDNERHFLADFVTNKVNHINKHLLTNSVSKTEYNYLNEVTKHLVKLPFAKFEKGYCVLEFDTKVALFNWLERFGENGEDIVPMYLHFSDSVIESCNFNGIDHEDLNRINKYKSENITTYLIIEINNFYGLQSFVPYTSSILPKGVQLLVGDYKENIYNTGTLTDPDRLNNTIYMKVDGIILPD